MKRLTHALCLAAIVVGVAAATSASAAGKVCVGNGQGCFATLQAALDAANDGDTIKIAPGTFAGGVTIDCEDIASRGSDMHTLFVCAGGGPADGGSNPRPSRARLIARPPAPDR